MFYQEKQIDNLLGKLVDKQLGYGNLINQLIYGKNMKHLNPFTRIQEDVVLYLHENNPQILIAMKQSGQTQPFDIRRTKLQRDNYRLADTLFLNDKIYLILREDYQQLILLFDSEQQRQKFKRSIKQISTYLADYTSDIDSTIVKNFIKADKNRNDQLCFDEFYGLLRQIKLGDQAQINDLQNFIKSQSAQRQKIRFRQFQRIAQILSCRKQLIQTFQSYSQSKLTEYRAMFQKMMDKQQFLKFLITQQQQTLQNAQEIANMCFLNNKSRISFYQFCQIITSPLNNVIPNSYYTYQTPLNHPLHHYYCFSSHNTYLTGNQLTSDSRAQRYYEDLTDGIRCVEIDCHDGANGPIVKHGYTVTSSITFEQVIKIIQKFRQQNPRHTPIILSLENHCSSENQYQMSKIIQKYMKDNLVTICQFEQNQIEYTLQNTMGKVIIKGSGKLDLYMKMLSRGNKKGQVTIEQVIESQGSELQSFQDPDLSEMNTIVDQAISESVFTQMKQAFSDKMNLLKQRKKNFQNYRPNIQKYITEHFSYHKHKQSKKLINLKLLAITSMLGNGTVGSPCHWESCSISQRNVLSIIQANKQERVSQHALKGWIRVYPRGTRFDSSNFNPLPALQIGAQIIALNTQMNDYPNYIMQKFFDMGKKTTHGYRLKPNLQNLPQKYKKIKITPISASKIYYNNPKRSKQIPGCQIFMRYYGLAKDMKLNSQEIQWKSYTQNQKQNSFNPIYQATNTIILRYHLADIAFLVMSIPECGVSVLPVGYLKKGIRCVTLYDEQLRPKQSKIIIRVQ